MFRHFLAATKDNGQLEGQFRRQKRAFVTKTKFEEKKVDKDKQDEVTKDIYH